MGNLNDYVRAKSNVSLSTEGFNEIDGLVLSELSYVDWKGAVPNRTENGSVTLQDAISALKESGAYKKIKDDNIRQLLDDMQNSERYKNMQLSNYDAQRITIDQAANEEGVKQFSAVTFSFNKNGSDQQQNFVAFRGTDNTLEGWQEDFNMAFDMHTEAQIESKEYLDYVAENLHGDIMIGGHSKGGNNTYYSYLFCSDDTKERITGIYSYDAPGLFNDRIIKTEEYKKMLELLEGNSLAPKNSVIGLLLNETEFKFVDTDETIVLSHDAFTWKIDIDNNTFVVAEQTDASKLINNTLDDLLGFMTLYDRKTLVNALWRYINKQDVDSFDDVLDLVKDQHIGIAVDIYLSGDYSFMEKMVILGTITAGVYFAGSNLIEFAVDNIEEKKKQLVNAIDRRLETLQDKFKTFFTDLRVNVISMAQKYLVAFNRNFNTGYQQASVNSYIRIDTARMRWYADRLNRVNGRITKLDSRLDKLYRKVGLKDLFALVQADAMTRYHWRLKRCVNYLYDTAYDFERADNSIASQLN